MNPSNAAFTNANNYAMSCVLDGITAPCEQVMRAVNNGTIDPNSLRLSTTGGPADFANAGLGGLVLDLSNPHRDWKENKVALTDRPKLRPYTPRPRLPGGGRPDDAPSGDPRGGEASGHWGTYYEISAFFQEAFVDPQTTEQGNPYPGCITANWFVNNPEIKKIFNDYWSMSQKSGKENGGWFFYEPKTNTLIGKSSSEGEKSEMPNELKEFDAQMAQFKQNGQSVIFMFDFHVHPGGSRNYSSGDLGNVNSVNKQLASVGAAAGGHFPIGIVIYGPGQITLYDRNGLINEVNSRWNECL